MPPPPAGKIDQLVFARLKQLGIRPAALCSDEVFLRRVYLDVMGTLAHGRRGAAVSRRTRARQAPALVDRLLERDERPTIGR